MNKFYLEIITPEKVFFRGEAESVNIPSIGGACTIMAGHQPMVFATGRRISTSAARRRQKNARKRWCAATAARPNISSTASRCRGRLRACASNTAGTTDLAYKRVDFYIVIIWKKGLRIIASPPNF